MKVDLALDLVMTSAPQRHSITLRDDEDTWSTTAPVGERWIRDAANQTEMEVPEAPFSPDRHHLVRILSSSCCNWYGTASDEVSS